MFQYFCCCQKYPCVGKKLLFRDDEVFRSGLFTPNGGFRNFASEERKQLVKLDLL